MSNGARLAALVVVVAVAAVGLYFAFVTPSAAPATSGASMSSTDSIASLDAPATPGLDASTPGAPPAEAFGGPSSPMAGGPEALTLGPAGASTTGVTAGSTTGTVTAGTTTSGGTDIASTANATASPTSSKPVVPTGNATTTRPVTVNFDPRTVAADPAMPTTAGSRSYVIKSGDTLEAIARAQLGDGQKWRQIASANPGINPNNLKVGQSITIPEGGVEAPRAAGSVGTATPVEGNAYTVQKGDTLVALSRKFYGGDGEWKRILEANRSLLKGDPASLKPGMKLTIPAKR
ncbi:MAG: LysM peptidoglycan-binding domain-containing protein [Phycisphaerales bacterium]|nr:LysM peptidoglycan-binding domain-containing protein [Phycisphaerales bacterium]